jgi:hypothetical protein
LAPKLQYPETLSHGLGWLKWFSLIIIFTDIINSRLQHYPEKKYFDP